MRRNWNDHQGTRLCASENEWSDVAFAMENTAGYREPGLAQRIRTHGVNGHEWKDGHPCIPFSAAEIALVEAWSALVLARALPDW